MNGNSEKSGSRSWLWNLLIFLFVAGMLAANIVPYFVGSHTSKIMGIINNLRQIDGAKSEWAVEHGFTNYSLIAELTNRLTEQDLIQILPRRSGKQATIVPSIDGEIYVINPMNKSPEAKLVRKIYSYPKGSIIRLASDTNKPPWEIIFPDGTKQRF